MRVIRKDPVYGAASNTFPTLIGSGYPGTNGPRWDEESECPKSRE